MALKTVDGFNPLPNGAVSAPDMTLIEISDKLLPFQSPS